MIKMKDVNPAFKHVHTAVRQAKMKGFYEDSKSALIHYGLMETFDLSDPEAVLMLRSVLAYAASLIIKRDQTAGLDVLHLKLDEINGLLDRPPFLDAGR
jgi:hypothetical protein